MKDMKAKDTLEKDHIDKLLTDDKEKSESSKGSRDDAYQLDHIQINKSIMKDDFMKMKN